MWEVMKTHYAHFDTHGVDWAARKSFRPDPQANDATLWKALQDALSGLDDGHTYIAASDQVWSPAIAPAWHNDRHLMRDTTLATVADISEPNAFGLQAGFVFRKQTRITTGMTAPFTATLAPQDTHWPGPVILLTTRYTASAAEIFTLAMRELPQVVTLGEPTSGGLSEDIPAAQAGTDTMLAAAIARLQESP